MPRHSAPITSDQYIQLRGNHRTKWLVIPNPNTVKFAARVNQTTFATSFNSVTFDTVTTGAYTDVKVGWTVYLSHTSNIEEAFFRGRVRKTPTSSVLYINRTSVAVADNDYVWVIRDTALHEKLPYYDGTTLYVDDDLSYTSLPPIVTNLPHAVAGKLGSGGNVDFVFAPTALACTSGASISSYAWDADGGSFQAGSSSTQNVTIRFTTSGWREIRLTVTDSDGRTNFFAISCAVYPEDYSSVVALDLLCTGTRYEQNVGWTATLQAAAGSITATLLAETELIVVAEDVFNDVAGSILSNIKFVGRIRQDDTSINVGLSGRRIQISSETRLELESIGAQMGRLILPSMTLRDVTTVTAMGELTNLTLWRGMVFLSTLLTTLSNVASLGYDSTNNDYAYPLFTAQDRSTESSLSDIAFTINAYLNYLPSGEIYTARHMHYLDASAKAALVNPASWTNRDYTGQASIKRERVQRVGRVIGFAGSYNTASGDIVTLRCKAPAEVPGQGEGRGQLNRQVLIANLSLTDAKAEVELRTGADLARQNLVTTLDVDHPSGYDNVLFPDVSQPYTWTIAASSNLAGFACDTSKLWWLQSVSVTYNVEKGYTTTKATYVEDVSSLNAQTISEIAPDDTPADVGSLPPLLDFPFGMLPSLQFPDGTDIAPEDEQPFTADEVAPARKPPAPSTDPAKPAPTPAQDPPSLQGQVVACGDSGSVFVSRNFALSGNPAWRNITPPTTNTITAFRFDPFSGGAYALSNDGSNSQFWRCSNYASADWVATSLDGVWKRIGLAGAGQVYVYGVGATWTETFDLTASAAGWQAIIVNFGDIAPQCFYSAGEGFVTPTVGGLRAGQPQIGIYYDFGAATAVNITSVVLTYSSNNMLPSGGGFNSWWALGPDQYTPDVQIFNTTEMNSANLTSVYGAGAGTKQVLWITQGNGLNQYNPPSKAVLSQIVITGTGTNPFTGISGSGLSTRYSTDSGASFAAVVAVGDDPSGDGGMSANLAGSQVIAAQDGKARVASAGGAFSDGATTTGSYPISLWGYGASGYLMASAAGVGGETLWNGGSAITPNDGSNDGIALGNDAVCTPIEGSLANIFMAGQFGGSKKLARSVNAGAAWAFTTLGSSTNGYVRAKNANQVYLANGSSIAYSENGGANFTNKPSPVASTAFVEVR